MTLNGVMAVTLRYFTEFGKPALQKTICGGIYARVYCIFIACTMSSQRKFTFAISSDEFLVSFVMCCFIITVSRVAFYGAQLSFLFHSHTDLIEAFATYSVNSDSLRPAESDLKMYNKNLGVSYPKTVYFRVVFLTTYKHRHFRKETSYRQTKKDNKLQI